MNAIETRDLRRVFKTRVAVDLLNLAISEGEIFALLGQNGAGKTTTIRMLSCLLPPTSGDAELLGDSIVKNANAVKQKINVSPQETAVAPNLTLRENLELIARLYGESREKAKGKAQEMLETFHLEQRAGDRAKNLSGGMQRRLSIAMALISDPRILFLDEPTLGLDVRARRELWQYVERLKGKMTIVLTTHYLEEAEALADHIAIMNAGRIAAQGTAAEIIRQTGQNSFEDAFLMLTDSQEDS